MPYFSHDILYQPTHPCGEDNHNMILQTKDGDAQMDASKTLESELGCYHGHPARPQTDQFVPSLFFSRNMTNHSLLPLARWK